MKIRWQNTVCLMVGISILWGCDYARMREQESIRTYETSMPEMVQGTVPIQGGLQGLRETDLEDLKNPLAYEGASIDQGKRAYGYFCIMCHGPNADGNGTVGQSFYPLPTNLKSEYVQVQSDAELFYAITFGIGRHPPLGYTAAGRDRWAIVHYIRFLAKKSGEN
ncbi:MAG: cytochrome c [Proteobacteria bacterium]|nr:cytochrome c [Pseudomonadota bacterium]NIS67872.1 cytochrome c [Pseudomonadota bacterium]